MNTATQCPSAVDLRNLLVGTLPEGRTEELAAHVETCDRCRSKLENLAAGERWSERVAENLRDSSRPMSVEAQRLLEDWRKQPRSEDSLSGRDELERLSFLEPSDDPGVLGRLGPYEVTEIIGRGGFGLVLKGRDLRLNRVVAVKVLAPEWASNATARKRFLREAQAAAAVRHDHVVTIHAVDQVDQLPYLVMEYVPGDSLQQRLDRQGPLETREILRIARQIALGLAAAHAEGLIHRDIKPGNILLEDGVQRVKITDFGLARAVDDVGMTQTGTVAGTPEYMSPEQAWGEAVDHRTDLFSLGGVMYAMCTGRSPFRAGSAMAVLRRVCEDQPRFITEVNSEIPLAVVGIVERLLQKDPDERFQSAEEVAHVLGQQLAALQNAETILLPPAPPTPEPRRPRRTHPPTGSWSWFAQVWQRTKGEGGWSIRWRWVSFAASGAFVLMIAGIVWFEQRSSRSRKEPQRGYSVTDKVDSGIEPTPDWTPPLSLTSELVLDVQDPQVRIAIDGRPYPVERTGPRELRLSDGIHIVTVADERGEFDKMAIHLPTTESHLQIDRGGIARSAVPSHVEVRWLRMVHSTDRLVRFMDQLTFRSSLSQQNDRLLGRFSSGLRTWNLDTGEAGPSVPSSDSPWFAVSPNGAYLAIGGEKDSDGRVRLIDIRDPDPSTWLKELVVTQHGGAVRLLKFSPDSRLLLCGSDSRTEVFRLDGMIATAVAEIDRTKVRIGKNWRPTVAAAAFLPDSRRVLLGDYAGNVELWDTHTGQCEFVIEGTKLSRTSYSSIDVSPDGRLALLMTGGIVLVLDIEQEKVTVIPEWPQEIVGIARFLPDSRRCVLVERIGGQKGRDVLHIGDVQMRQITATLDLDEVLRTRGNGVVHDVRIAPDASRVTAACEIFADQPQRTLGIAILSWKIPERTTINTKETDVVQSVGEFEIPAAVYSFAFTADGKQLATGCMDGLTRLWSFPDGKLVHELDSGGKVGNFEVKQDQLGVLRPVRTHTNPRIAFSPDDARLAVISGTTLTVWDRETGKRLARAELNDPAQREGQTYNRLHGINSIAWSSDGKRLLLASAATVFVEEERLASGQTVERSVPIGYACLVELDGETVKIVQRFAHTGGVSAAMFLGDGRRVVTAGLDGQVQIWSVETGESLGEPFSMGSPLLALDATPDGNYLAAGADDGSLRVWETRFGRPILRRGPGSATYALYFLPDESRLLTADQDDKLRLWSLTDGAEIAAWNVGKAAAVAVHPQAAQAVIASAESNHVRIWQLPRP